MTADDDDEIAVSYKILARGTPVLTSDGAEIGTVRDVLENDREHLFDGIVIETPGGRRFVDAPEVARITSRRVTLTIDEAAAGELPERDRAGGPTFRANARAGRFQRFFGGGWRRGG
jgi:sporulation protein YlmC with PRC-barrel domain